MTREKIIFHIAKLSDYNLLKSNGRYQCESLEGEGFIHCCDEEQLQGVLERYYNGVNDVILFRLDGELIEADLVYENTSGGEELFPHIYGPINPGAIVETFPFDLKSDKRRKYLQD